MSGRRSHPRYVVATPWDGAMRVLRDVVIHRTEGNELQAFSNVPAVAGEEMTLDVMGAGETIGLKVKVVDSRPVMVEGAVRHRIRLAVLKAPRAEANAPANELPGAITANAATAEAL